MHGMPLPPPVGVRLTTLPSQPCNYLPGRNSTTRAFRINQLPGSVYHHFMDAGFRRSGSIIYQPVCEGCQSCIPIRVEVARFKPDKSQRRCARSNSDLIITESAPELTDEKFDLYRQYLINWHGREPSTAGDRESLEEFLYCSPVSTIEFCYRTCQHKLIGVGIADVCKQSLSSVYFYFSPAESHRGLGNFSAMHEIHWCHAHGIPYYYLGYWVDGCATMQYKRKFRPAEILGPDGIWVNLAVEDGA